ncbi:bifunctional (p)ppGpp synthetase/guanosine-3',5'-bis(diphosphate) 3'-pyrophosphohydrolase [Candidatus Peregrinibacteria bacterium]|nr:bifunctional (p)ppGpp synthetase/guanosine-3',5'-bis(diphosphate) 3'-pyrophosphohydrolase [Candidatus Peregrinibacteria bacterium]
MLDKVTIGEIIKGAKKYLPHVDEKRVLKAYEIAKKAHKGQKRASGEPYINHPLNVAKILIDLKPDEDSIIAALLHDVIEDTEMKVDELSEIFGESIVPLLNGMEKLKNVYYRGRERQIENLRKMFIAMSNDIRVILIKLADRLHNMRTLEFLREEKQKIIAKETLTVYSPIAGRLGIFRIKNELDNLSFMYLHPEDYKRINEDMKKYAGKQMNVIKKCKNILAKSLKKAKIEAKLEGRVKHLYSISKKLKAKDKNYISELYDIFALRIIVKDEATCYQTLGMIHKNWMPLPRRFKDYIGHPKPNGYQSLHTTVIGIVPDLRNQPIEIQIRSEDMNVVAKFGIAAHWQYKEKSGYSIAVPEDKLKWIQSLVSVHEHLKNNTEFTEALSMDIFHDRIFVLTPKADVLDLPSDATPIDFAYSIHTDIGHRCKGAKVNNKIVPLDYKLKNGEVIEIITSNKSEPNRYWLSFAKTTHAQNRIKQWFNSQDKDNLIKIGKEMINKHLKRFEQKPLGPGLTILRKYSDKKMTVREREELLEKVGNGSVDVMAVINKIIPPEKVMKKTPQAKMVKEVLSEGVKLDKSAEVLITGEKGYFTQIATCCKPKPPDNIVGYVTRGRGITIHKKGCKALLGHTDDRLIGASWNIEKNAEYNAKLLIKRQSRIGMLRDIADIFAVQGLPIMDIQNYKDTSEMMIAANFDSLEKLDLVIQQLEAIPGIFKVKEVS